MAWKFPFKLGRKEMRKLADVAKRAAPSGPSPIFAKLSDPLGKRIYHETFIGEDRGDGAFPWTCRVYDIGGLRAEKNGLAPSDAVARKQAADWAAKTRQTLLELP